MRLYIDLSAAEEADIRGWTNYYIAHPEMADYPTRIVLSERTRARYEQIAAQMGAPVPPIPPSDPLARFDAAPSEWAKWHWTDETEGPSLIARYGQPFYANEVAYYKAGGKGNIGGNRQPDGTQFGSYWFAKLVAGIEVLTLDQNGAADAYIASLP